MNLKEYAFGKLMLAGEYSVLFGGTCLVAPSINYKAYARFDAGRYWKFFARTSHAYTSNVEHKLFVAALQAARRLGFSPKIGSYYVDTSAFYNRTTGHKLGMGSSAAATTALAKIFLSQIGLKDRCILLELALEAHKIFSETLGSGADVAAAVYEETIEFYNNKAGIIVKPVDLFWWTELIWIDTQHPQNTRTFVAQVQNMVEKDPKIMADFVHQSDYWCARFCDPALREKEPEKVAEIMSGLYALLESLGTVCKINIISTEHRRIHELALSCGGSAKPSGAGGGDLSIAWVPHPMRAEFLSKLKNSAFATVQSNM